MPYQGREIQYQGREIRYQGREIQYQGREIQYQGRELQCQGREMQSHRSNCVFYTLLYTLETSRKQILFDFWVKNRLLPQTLIVIC